MRHNRTLARRLLNLCGSLALLAVLWDRDEPARRE